MKIGIYEIVRLLGKGGMSEVYEAENPRLGSRHAIKVYAYKNDDADVRRRFETEGRLLARLSHPRIVKVTDIGVTDDGRPYFVMDLVLNEEGENKSLGDISSGEVDEETIGRWYDDVRDALAYIHKNGVVHRDLKLQNVLIGADGHAVLTDFGISRIFEPEGSERPIVDTVQTLVRVRDGKNAVMGSIGYMAPELEMGVAATAESDWYALGVIVYKLLTGTWCDARTDVVTTLETYDPVWMVIIPKLLHANPAGRECLSYAEEKTLASERALADWENRWLKEKSRGHSARHIARYIALVAVALALSLAFGYWHGHRDRQRLLGKIRQFESMPKAMPFDSLFRVPQEAKTEETYDDQGNVVIPSRQQFVAAKVDALVLTRNVMNGLQTGDMTLEDAIAEFERWADALDEESDRTPFDDMEIGGEPYTQHGQDLPLQMLLRGAVEKLKELVEE